MDVESRLKTALDDESRLLILGAQELFGFQFEAVFQECFPDVSDAARHMHGAGLVLMLISISLLIAPSLFHQIVFAGNSRPGAIEMATMLVGIVAASAADVQGAQQTVRTGILVAPDALNS